VDSSQRTDVRGQMSEGRAAGWVARPSNAGFRVAELSLQRSTRPTALPPSPLAGSCRRQLGRGERGKCSRFTVSPNLQLCTKQPHPRLNPPLEGSGLPTSMLSCGFDLIRRKQQRRPLNPVIARSVATWQSRIVNKSSEASILKGYKKYVRYAHSLRRWIATSWLRGFAATPLLAMTGFGGILCCFCLTKSKSHDNILVGKPEP